MAKQWGGRPVARHPSGGSTSGYRTGHQQASMAAIVLYNASSEETRRYSRRLSRRPYRPISIQRFGLMLSDHLHNLCRVLRATNWHLASCLQAAQQGQRPMMDKQITNVIRSSVTQDTNGGSKFESRDKKEEESL